MLNKFFFFCCFIVLIYPCTSHADKSLDLIQVTQPEKERIDIKWYPFFFLETQEEKALIALSNQHTFYTYDHILNKPSGIERKIGPVTINIKVQSLDRQGAGGAAPGIELSIYFQDQKIVDQIVLKRDYFSKISVIYINDDMICLSLTSDSMKNQIQNYNLKTKLKSPLKSLDDIKTSKKI